MFLMVIRGGIARPVVACLVAILLYASAYASAETGAQAETIERARRTTVGILEDTQDPRTPDKPGKIKIRGTGFHLHDGYIVTARHAVEKNSPTLFIITGSLMAFGVARVLYWPDEMMARVLLPALIEAGAPVNRPSDRD